MQQVRLADFRFRINERFVYEYDFGDTWQHEVRIEQRLPLDDTGVYPRCIGGRRQAPPEDCGGPLAFMAQRDRLPIQADELLWQLHEDMRVAIWRPFEIGRQRSTPCPNGWRSKLSIGERSTVGSSNTR